ncbi:unnamed protein product [Linum tenue]|uniref:Uncharacterized protein n=1 Tax=Linum tenue TaxID=586396 RepID=A0AAV0PQ12_9ROSI|nr:unnamed protein product [Linum tenue]
MTPQGFLPSLTTPLQITKKKSFLMNSGNSRDCEVQRALCK